MKRGHLLLVVRHGGKNYEYSLDFAQRDVQMALKTTMAALADLAKRVAEENPS